MALVCGNCGGDLALEMTDELLELEEETSQTVNCIDCGKYGVLSSRTTDTPDSAVAAGDSRNALLRRPISHVDDRDLGPRESFAGPPVPESLKRAAVVLRGALLQ